MSRASVVAWVGALVVIVALCWPAPFSATASATPIDTAVEAATRAALDAAHAQSISTAVVLSDGRMLASAAGVADKVTKRHARTTTSYAVASITKMFVATAAMQLVDEGVLTLDEPVARWLPDLSGAAVITLRDLLGHTSGLTAGVVDGNLTHRWTPAEVLAQTSPPVCEPRACFNYADDNFVAAGQVIAAATGQPIETVLRTRILQPLHLGHSWLQGFERPRGVVAPGAAGGDSLFDDPNGNVPATEFVTRIGAGGALASTAPDLARFGEALFRGDLIDADSLRTMTDPEPSASLPCADVRHCSPGYGLGVETTWVAGWRVLGHSGSTGTLVVHFPEEEITIAVVTNGGGDPFVAAGVVADAIPALRGRLDLFTIDVDGTAAPRRLGHGGDDRLGAAVSPDGSRLAFTRGRGERARLVVSGIDGSHARVLVDDLAEPGGPTWSPDGRRLAFSAHVGRREQIFLIDADGSHRTQLTDDEASNGGPRWSPDGSLLAFHRYLRDEVAIEVMRPDGTHERTAARAPIRGPWMGYPRWSPDGRELAFTGSDGFDTDIQIVGVDGSNLRTITSDHVPESDVAWADDGRIAFARFGDLVVVDPTHGPTSRLTNSSGGEFGPEWLSGSTRLLFTSRISAPEGS